MTTTSSTDVKDRVSEIIKHITTAVSTSEDAEEARKKLAEIVKQQGVAAAEAEELEKESKPVVVKGLTVEEKVILRPNGQEYHVRMVGDHEDIAMLRKSREAGLPILAYGPPGTGKTAMIEAAYGNIHTVVGTGDTEVSDFIGSFVQLPGGKFVWEDGPLLKAMENGEVLFIDEIALVDPKVLSIVYPLMDGRDTLTVTANPDRGTVKAQPGFFVAGACNPDAPGARLSEAVTSRFVNSFEVLSDYDLCKRLGVNPKLVLAATNLQRKVDNGECTWAPQTRELLAAKKIEDAFGQDYALSNLVSVALEIDRPVVAEVLSKVFGRTVETLRIANSPKHKV